MRTENEQLRLFLAADLPDEVRQALGRLQGELKRQDLSGLRWVRPQGIHLTLKFLGEVPAPAVPSIRESVAGAVEGAEAFRLALGGLCTFGNRRGPRVLWLGIEGQVERLKGLQTAVEAALTEAGFDPEEREFSPHLTLARVRQPAPPGTGDRIERALSTVAPPHEEFTITEIDLMRSTLGPDGAVYDRVAAFPLG